MTAWPYFAADEIAAVTQVLQSGKVNYWTGTECTLFEQEFAAYVGVNHAIAVSNGTVALELALLALDIKPGDEVIVPSRTFIATASCVVSRGARPVIADVDLNSQNITAETIKPLITPQTKAIIVVHLAGWACDMDAILALAQAHNLFVIEDCAQAHGATYKGKPIGSIGDIAAFSFCQDKIMTTGGEGGMITTNHQQYWQIMWAYKDHGKSYEKCYQKNHPPGFRWLHDSFGSNARMTEMQAAIGRLQLQKLNHWIESRRRNAAILQDMLKEFACIRLTKAPDDIGHAYYKYYCFLDPVYLKAGWSRDSILAEINQAGVPCFTGSCSEIYLEQAFIKAGYVISDRLPQAKKLGETSLMFLVHPTLDENSMRHSAQLIKSVLEKASLKK